MSQDDDNDSQGDALDENPDLIVSMDVAKKRIRELTREKKRKKDYETRLMRKLEKLDQDLAIKREEVQSFKRMINLEKNKDASEASTRKREAGVKKTMQEERVREYLNVVLHSKKVAKTAKKKKDQQFELETVLINFTKPNDTNRYNLSFRVDNETLIHQLLADACKYWNVSPDQYILQTLAHSKCQNEIKLGDCFKQGDIAQLKLVKKNPSNTEVTEAEKKAIQAKGGKARNRGKSQSRNKNLITDTSNIQNFNEQYQQQLQKMGGIYLLLKMPDSKPPEFESKIHFRDMIVYTALAIITFVMFYTARPAGFMYWSAQGVKAPFMVKTTNPVTGEKIPAFDDINKLNHVWDWITYTMPSQIWNTTFPSVRSYQDVLGYVQIRVQNIKEPSEEEGSWKYCPDFKAVMQRLDATKYKCYPTVIDEDTEDKSADVRIERYWPSAVAQGSASGITIRGPEDPSVWRSSDFNSDNHNIGGVWGYIQTYDASGYVVAYRVAVPDAEASEYRADMLELRRMEWISQRTRLVVVSFTSYNINLDTWVASDFIFEIQDADSVLTHVRIRPFQPRLDETKAQLTLLYFNFVRIGIAIYILLFVGTSEKNHKEAHGKGGYRYYFRSLNGFCDLGIVACCVAHLVWMKITFGDDETKVYLRDTIDADNQKGYQGFEDMASQYEILGIVDGLLFFLVMLRLISLARINQEVYLLWHTIGESRYIYIYIMVLFAHFILGFAFLSHRIYGGSLETNWSFADTLLNLYDMMKADSHWEDAYRVDWIWTTAYFALFYFICGFGLMCTTMTIMIDAYYVVQLTSSLPGLDKKRWTATRFRKWICPRFFIDICNRLFPGAIVESN